MVKFSFGAGPGEVDERRPRLLRENDAKASQRRVFETVKLRTRRADHGVGGKFVVQDSHPGRAGLSSTRVEGRYGREGPRPSLDV